MTELFCCCFLALNFSFLKNRSSVLVSSLSHLSLVARKVRNSKDFLNGETNAL